MHILVGLFVALCFAFALVCLLIPVVGFTAVVVLWPFQELARLLRRLPDWLFLCGLTVLSALICAIWNPGWGMVTLGAGAMMLRVVRAAMRSGYPSPHGSMLWSGGHE